MNPKIVFTDPNTHITYSYQNIPEALQDKSLPKMYKYALKNKMQGDKQEEAQEKQTLQELLGPSFSNQRSAVLYQQKSQKAAQLKPSSSLTLTQIYDQNTHQLENDDPEAWKTYLLAIETACDQSKDEMSASQEEIPLSKPKIQEHKSESLASQYSDSKNDDIQKRLDLFFNGKLDQDLDLLGKLNHQPSQKDQDSVYAESCDSLNDTNINEHHPLDKQQSPTPSIAHPFSLSNESFDNNHKPKFHLRPQPLHQSQTPLVNAEAWNQTPQQQKFSHPNNNNEQKTPYGFVHHLSSLSNKKQSTIPNSEFNSIASESCASENIGELFDESGITHPYPTWDNLPSQDNLFGSSLDKKSDPTPQGACLIDPEDPNIQNNPQNQQNRWSQFQNRPIRIIANSLHNQRQFNNVHLALQDENLPEKYKTFLENWMKEEEQENQQLFNNNENINNDINDID